MSETLGDIDDFLECCEQQAWFFDEGLISLQLALDNLQHLAELWGLVDEIGQDAVQAHMAAAFAIVRGMAPRERLPNDYPAQLVRDWELQDERDSWRHTGGLPPVGIRNGTTDSPRSRPHQGVPQSTLDAFKFVASRGDPDHLARWLRDHADVAPALLEYLREAA